MGTSTVGALPYPPATGVTPRVHLDIQDLTTALDPQIVPKFADTTARDAAYSGMSATPKEGARCWIRNRDGYSFFDGTVWRWEPQRNTLTDSTRPSPANPAIGGVIPIISVGPFTLPPGNRLIEVFMSAECVNLGGAGCLPRIYDNLTGRNVQVYLPGGPNTVSIQGALPRGIASGTYSLQMYGKDATGTSAVSFINSFLQVYDLGPTD